MFLFGAIALIQTTFLPGVLLLKVLQTRWRLIPTIVYAFGFSLIVNYSLVLVLTSVHLYTKQTVLTIFGIEVLVALYLYRQALLRDLNLASLELLKSLKDFTHSQITRFRQWLDQINTANAFAKLFYLLVAGFIVGYAFSVVFWGYKVWTNGFGMVIDHWDAIASWNRWATDWANNQFPTKTWEYPQLIPINLSISYVLVGSTKIQLFNTAYLGLFTFYILLLGLVLVFRNPSLGLFAGVIATKFILKKFTGVYINTAYADIPLAFFAFSSIFPLLNKSDLSNEGHLKRALWISFLLAAGAAVTKQGGLFMLLFIPLYFRFELLPKIHNQGEEKITLLWLPLIGSLLIVLPWYVYVRVGIHAGVMDSNIAWVADGIHGNLTYLERFFSAFNSLGIYRFLLLITLIGGLWLDRTYRWLVYGIVLPYFIGWAFFFGYSPRNLSLVFAFWGLAAGLIFEKIVVLAESLLNRLKLAKMPLAILVVLLAIVPFLGGHYFTDNRLIAQQEKMQRQILDAKINGLLYDYFEELGHVEPVLSNYPIDNLPGLELIKHGFRSEDKFDLLWTFNPNVNLMLMPNNAIDALKDPILEKVERGEYELIFYENRYYFIRRISP